MKFTKDAMLPHPLTVNLSDPELSGVDAVPNDDEPFMLRQHSDEDVTDYDDGSKSGYSRRSNDDTKSQAWQRGWAKAQE
jgi:hypothetical protein